MLLNIYFELSEEQFSVLLDFLKMTAIAYFDATQHDSYTSGPCAVTSLFDIQADLENR